MTFERPDLINRPLRALVPELAHPCARRTLYDALRVQRDAQEPQINAFEARSEESPPAPKGPLNGLPITVKDQIAVAGWSRSFGLDRVARKVERTSAPVIAQLEALGAQVTGKTALAPHAMDFQTANARRGATCNPHNPRFTSGGSSGGSAAAVASGMSVLDFGADLAGSLRLPVAWCGVTSLTPTEGALSGAGLLAGAQSLDHFARMGPIARQVDDLAYVWDVLSEPAEAASAQTAPPHLALWSAQGEVPCDAPTLAAWQAFTVQLEHGPFAVTRDAMAQLFTPETYRLAGEIIGYETGALVPFPIRWLMRRDRVAAGHSPGFLAHVHAGYRRDKARHVTNLSQLVTTRAQALAQWSDADVLILPVTGICAFEHLPPTRDRGGVRDYDQTFETQAGPLGYFDALTRFTLPLTLLGWPVVTVPIGRDANGLPIGAQVVGKPQAEAQVLDIARQIEGVVQFQ